MKRPGCSFKQGAGEEWFRDDGASSFWACAFVIVKLTASNLFGGGVRVEVGVRGGGEGSFMSLIPDLLFSGAGIT